MGDEWGARTPFLFFCDFNKDLAEAVRKGRRREFARFAEFARSASQDAIPDPQDIQTFEASRLDRSPSAVHPELARLYQQLLQVRHRQIIPRISGIAGTGGGYRIEAGLCSAWWRLADGSRLRLDANLSDDACSAEVLPEDWSILYATSPNQSDLLPWSVLWRLQVERQL
jgi:maltooligosyltrehalose trehalohydrolase